MNIWIVFFGLEFLSIIAFIALGRMVPFLKVWLAGITILLGWSPVVTMPATFLVVLAAVIGNAALLAAGVAYGSVGMFVLLKYWWRRQRARAAIDFTSK